MFVFRSFTLSSQNKSINTTFIRNLQSGAQVALASLECVQAATLLLNVQSTSLVSFPVQPTLFNAMEPLPWPNAAPDCAVASASKTIQCSYGKIENGHRLPYCKVFVFKLANVLNLEYPSCLQTTLASIADHMLSQTVLQVSWTQTSTRPVWFVGPTRRTSPCWQTAE